jgi:hypothetical protein
VALENARLFEETNRLLKETVERNSELGVINKVGQSLAAQLDPQQIFEFVGETLNEVFMAQVTQIITYDRQTDLVNYRYQIEKGERYYIQPRVPAGFCAKSSIPPGHIGESGSGDRDGKNGR